jgi:hypothetical protein
MKKLKKAVILPLSTSIIISSLGFTSTAFADSKSVELHLTVGSTIADINGTTKNTVAPYISNSTTLVPLRIISEGFGAEVEWNSDDKSVTITDNGKVIKLTINSKTATVNGQALELAVAPEIKNDTTMVPIRFIAEALDTNVTWNSENKTITITNKTNEAETALNKIDNTKWNYNSEDKVYWQVGIQYCSTPVDLTYETLGIFVPAEYMNATDNGDGTFTCEINTTANVNGYTAETAPVVIPVETPGYASMKAPTDYVNGVSDYTNAGFIYVNAGCRGRNEGAPTGVTDLKAAVKYIRYNEGNIAGSTERIFTFGMSGGGAQSALMGATGDSELYTPYLNAIGAVEGYSDAVAGSMCWCPITNLDYANEAYEWNLGSSRSDLSEDMQKLSDSMAEEFAEYINKLGLKDENGNTLTLEKSDEGIYQNGSYYEYIKSVIEKSLNNFLKDTAFPYTTGGSKKDIGGMMGGMANGGNRGERQTGMGGLNEFEMADGINRNGTNNASEEKTYSTAQEYIDSLNKDVQWINYDETTNTATITSVEAFVQVCKNASKSIGAFDDLDATQGENTLFGYNDGTGAHFDSIMAELLKDTEYGQAYSEDLKKTDSVGSTVNTRINMYNPMYFIEDYYDGYKSANVAKYWRIRTGINQGDTALSTEVNLALALESYGAEVDFETVWGEGHTKAERTGDSTSNFIEWVNECLKSDR